MVRATKDYTPKDDRIISKIQMWNDTFNIPYREVRRQIALIASDNYHLLGADAIYFYEENWCYESIKKLGDGWVLPIDDDDWLPNNIFDPISKVSTENKLCYWDVLASRPITWFGKNNYRNCPNIYMKRRNPEEWVFSCGYAFSIKDANFKILSFHESTKQFSGILIPEIFSCYSASPLSTWGMVSLVENQSDFIKQVENMQLIDVNKFLIPEFKNKYLKLKDLFSQIKVK